MRVRSSSCTLSICAVTSAKRVLAACRDVRALWRCSTSTLSSSSVTPSPNAHSCTAKVVRSPSPSASGPQPWALMAMHSSVEHDNARNAPAGPSTSSSHTISRVEASINNGSAIGEGHGNIHAVHNTSSSASDRKASGADRVRCWGRRRCMRSKPMKVGTSSR